MGGIGVYNIGSSKFTTHERPRALFLLAKMRKRSNKKFPVNQAAFDEYRKNKSQKSAKKKVNKRKK